ncbi:exodeoxyribonuclease VII large subunit, partial [Aquicoccus sp. SCR17]|nr:exodeoxyribonuclease VII large subunit [Carideicomes alvinocaridis]
GPALLRLVEARREALGRRADRLSIAPIERDLERKTQRFREAERALDRAGRRQVEGWADRLEGLERLRETLGYKATLRRGYAVVHSEAGLVTRKAEAEAATGLEIEFADGRVKIGGGSAAPKRKAGTKPPEQGSLF